MSVESGFRLYLLKFISTDDSMDVVETGCVDGNGKKAVAPVAEKCRVIKTTSYESELIALRSRCDHLDEENKAFERLHDGAVKERDSLRAELEERDSVWRKKKEVLENDLAKAMKENGRLREAIDHRSDIAYILSLEHEVRELRRRAGKEG